MSECGEVARTMLVGYSGDVASRGGIMPTMYNAREFIKAQYDAMPGNGWEDWITPVQLDNIAEVLYKLALYTMP